MKPFTLSTAHFSRNRKYRYTLERVWDPAKKKVMFIGLNPSKADEEKNDPTIHKCMRYAKRWGYGGIVMTNLFAYVATQPSDMKLSSEPIGRDNDDYIQGSVNHVDKVIAVWGDDGAHLGRNAAVRSLVKNLQVLKLSQAGHPRHPRFLKGDLEPRTWSS